VRDEEGIGLFTQVHEVAGIALGFCVPPFEIYRYRLYRRENRGRVSELIFDHTAEALRNQVDSPGPGTRGSRELLADKERQTAEFSALGVPMAPIRVIVRRGSSTKLVSCLSREEPLFCKPRHGSASVAAHTARLASGVLTVEPLHGLPLCAEAAEAYWQRALAGDDMLVQPRLTVHPDLMPAASDDDIVTVRYITQRAGAPVDAAEGLEAYCATLELPAGKEETSGACRYVVLAVDARTGEIGAFPEHYLPADAAARGRRARARLRCATVPGWTTIVAASARAHRHCLGVHAIAWDWAITAAGPLLLEGNAGWGVVTPQQLHGGLLRATEAR
jgi:hypothetical protein